MPVPIAPIIPAKTVCWQTSATVKSVSFATRRCTETSTRTTESSASRSAYGNAQGEHSKVLEASRRHSLAPDCSLLALVRMSSHPQTRDYVQRQGAKGRTKKEILRLLKRAIAREVFRLLTRPVPVDDYSDLRPARQAKNLTLATVANHFGVPIITVSRLERGHQRNDTLANNYRQWLTAA
jgi:hypothetical protein